MNVAEAQSLQIAPLGPGDLIDRAVRFYRGNFWTFVFMAAPPVVVGTVISVGWTFAARSFLWEGDISNPTANVPYYVFLWLGGSLIWFVQTVATLVVMGGASRNFVRHLLFGETITFRESYRNAWERLGALAVASGIIVFLLGLVCLPIFYFGFAIGAVAVMLVAVALASIPPLAFVVGAVIGLAAAFGTLWLIFLVASRFAYVPQSITVEGQGVFSGISRSVSLASGNVKRFAALFLFTTIAIYSALALFYIPIGWYAWYEGVEIFEFFVADQDLVPAWYEIASQLVWQASIILLSPVWMVGLCLLYVDERVRHEGYDIELMAARRLGEIPDVPQDYINPLQPALGRGQAVQQARPPGPPQQSGFTTLGLK